MSQTVMHRSVKLENQSPHKLEVLKPSNAQNINKNRKNIKPSVIKPTRSPGRTIAKSQGYQCNLKQSPAKKISPLKPLLPIRPSPSPKNHLINKNGPNCPTNFPAILRTPAPSAGVPTSSATSSATSSSTSSACLSISPVKCKRRISYSDNELRVPVSKRNARERNRVKQVSQGFAILRQHVPQAARKKKMSKVETLRCAVDYIRGLQLLLDTHPPPNIPPSDSQQQLQGYHHHQGQGQGQVFCPPHTIEPHILKLPQDSYQTPTHLRYDSVSGTFFRPSPTDSEGSGCRPLAYNKSDHPTPCNIALSQPVIKTEAEEQGYGREEQDLLEALAWWQHNIQS